MFQVVHVVQHDLETYLSRLRPAESDSVTERHLSGCEPCVARLTNWADFSATLFETALRPDGNKEQRCHPRFATNDTGVLQILNPFSVESLEIQISDVSKEGMRLHVPMSVERGSLIKVRMKNSLFFGEVRHCELAGTDDFFYVGVKLHKFVAAVSTAS
jgi:hypothetical protein